MVRIVFETPTDGRIELELKPEGSLMQAARAHLIPGIDADCGGCMVCGTCHVTVDPEWHSRLPTQSEAELEILEGVPDPRPNTRLTCQIPVTEKLDGIVLHLPLRQR